MVGITGDDTLQLHRLTFVPEADGVMIGRPDTGSYALFPSEGAEVVRRLASGASMQIVQAWFSAHTDTQLDLADLNQTLTELGFLLAADEVPPGEPVIRWTRIAAWLFSTPAWILYLAVTTLAVIAGVRDPSLRPRNADIFFTRDIALIPVVLAATQFPCLLIHEAFHALAARRLGLPSTLGIGRRFYYLVAETRLDALYSVPARQRYLPFLAGMLIDAVMASGLTLGCAVLRLTAVPGPLAALPLAVAYSCVLRLLWQLLFYLETDIYYVITTATGCTNLQAASRALIRNGIAVRFRRPVTDLPEVSPRELALARRYVPALVLGYLISIATLIFVWLPTVLRLCSELRTDLMAPGRTVLTVIDGFSFIAITGAQFGLLIYVVARDFRRRGRTRT